MSTDFGPKLWTQSIDLHLLSITEMVQPQFIAQHKQYDMFD